MNKRKVLTSGVSAIFLLMLVSSARADSVRVPPGQQKLDLPEGQLLTLADIDRSNVTDFLSEHFANNNGKHLGFANSGKHVGFSVAMFHGGVRFGLTQQRPIILVVENPEPASLLLLGTGLAAVAGFARRRFRRHKH